MENKTTHEIFELWNRHHTTCITDACHTLSLLFSNIMSTSSSPSASASVSSSSLPAYIDPELLTNAQVGITLFSHVCPNPNPFVSRIYRAATTVLRKLTPGPAKEDLAAPEEARAATDYPEFEQDANDLSEFLAACTRDPLMLKTSGGEAVYILLPLLDLLLRVHHRVTPKDFTSTAKRMFEYLAPISQERVAKIIANTKEQAAKAAKAKVQATTGSDKNPEGEEDYSRLPSYIDVKDFKATRALTTFFLRMVGGPDRAHPAMIRLNGALCEAVEVLCSMLVGPAAKGDRPTTAASSSSSGGGGGSLSTNTDANSSDANATADSIEASATASTSTSSSAGDEENQAVQQARKAVDYKELMEDLHWSALFGLHFKGRDGGRLQQVTNCIADFMLCLLYATTPEERRAKRLAKFEVEPWKTARDNVHHSAMGNREGKLIDPTDFAAMAADPFGCNLTAFGNTAEPEAVNIRIQLPQAQEGFESGESCEGALGKVHPDVAAIQAKGEEGPGKLFVGVLDVTPVYVFSTAFGCCKIACSCSATTIQVMHG